MLPNFLEREEMGLQNIDFHLCPKDVLYLATIQGEVPM